MKLIVFGATGKTGFETIRMALELDHEVTAFARDPAVFGFEHPRLTPFHGDILNAIDVDAAIRGQDAVIVCLDNGLRKAMADGTQNIITSMKRHGLTRLVCLTGLGQGETRNKLKSLRHKLYLHAIRPSVWAAKEQQENYVRSSGLEWTLVRPGPVIDDDVFGDVHILKDGDELPDDIAVSRADVAAFLLWTTVRNEFVNQAVGLTS